MLLCKEKKAAESEVLATCLQHISAAKTRRCWNRKPRWESKQAEWASSSLCQNNYLSHRRVDFPMKPRHRVRGEKHVGADGKKNPKQVTDVVVLVLVPLQRYRFGQRRQREELFIWQLIQSLRCSISPPCHHQLHNFALELKLPCQMGGTPTAFAGF